MSRGLDRVIVDGVLDTDGARRWWRMAARSNRTRRERLRRVLLMLI